MEKLQGQHDRTENASMIQDGPSMQHDFFQWQSGKNLPQATGPTHPNMPTFALNGVMLSESCKMREQLSQPEGSNAKAPAEKHWKGSWEWDSFLFAAQQTSSGKPVDAPCRRSPGVQDPMSKSASPLDKSETNGSHNKSKALDLRLKDYPAEDDGFLTLKLGGGNDASWGGNDASWGGYDLLPSVKRSRYSLPETQQQRCQVDYCLADLQSEKDYHRRHKVCEVHAKASKAPVSGIMQRFCQQCSRFHLLQEFDEDRRSCRRRLAGHNRRRRKTQPGAVAALSYLLADQNHFARIINTLGQLQGKEELERLLRVLSGGDTLLQTLSSTKAATGSAEDQFTPTGGIPSDLVNASAKSQALSNFLLWNPSHACNLPFVVPKESPVAGLSNALLLSALYLHQNHNKVGHLPGSTQEAKRLEACINGIDTMAAKTAWFFEKPDDCPVARDLNMIPNDKRSHLNGDSEDGTLHAGHAQSGGWSHGLIQPRTRQLGEDMNFEIRSQRLLSMPASENARNPVYLGNNPQNMTLKKLEKPVSRSDQLSDSLMDVQEQTVQVWFKIFDRGPGDLPSSLRQQMLEWLDNFPVEMESYIRPGCIILVIFLCMPVHAWERLCGNIEGSLSKLFQSTSGDFWCKGRVLVQLGDAHALIVEGKVYSSMNSKLPQTPHLCLVQPFAVVMGENVDLTLKGDNLNAPGTRVICEYGGKCIEKEVALLCSGERKREREEEQGRVLAWPNAQHKGVLTFRVGPFNKLGHGFIEVEGEMVKGNFFPVIIAERAICEEVCSLEKEFEISVMDKNPFKKRSSKTEAKITHFLCELGWLLQRMHGERSHVSAGAREFSPTRYRWLLHFAVERGWCAVVEKILDLLFSTGDGGSPELVHSKALETLSEANLLHTAVKSNARPMVKALLGYSPPVSGEPRLWPRGFGGQVAKCFDMWKLHDMQQSHVFFRPDTQGLGGLTPLHIAAGMHAADGLIDALTDAPKELWAAAWTGAKDSTGQTPLMYAIGAGNHAYVKMVQSKLQKLGNGIKATMEDDSMANSSDPQSSYLALNVVAREETSSSPSKLLLVSKRVESCTCKASRDSQNPALRICGTTYRPFVLSLLAIAALCVCVGVFMKGPPNVMFVEPPFVWESIGFGFI